MVKVYGPYTRKDGRKHVIIYEHLKVRKTVSYAKYLMEQHLGRKLEIWETVDHINRDFTDDRIENLQILEKSKHSSIDARRVKLIKIRCIWCGKNAFKRGSDINGNAKQGKAGPFCSKSCSGKYGTEVQNGRMQKLPAQKKVKPQYYYPEKSVVP